MYSGLQLNSQPSRGLGYQFCCLVNRGTIGVNSLHKTVIRQRCGCDLNPGPSVPESSTITTRLRSHPKTIRRDCWQMMVTLVGINQLLLEITDLSVAHVNLLLQLLQLRLSATFTLIRLHTNSHRYSGRLYFSAITFTLKPNFGLKPN